MGTVTIAHISDTHLGYSSAAYGQFRTQDFEEAWRLAVASIVAESPDLVIHSGDLFHRPRPTWSAVAAAIQGLNRLAETAPTIVIAGNHDMARLRTSHTVFDVLEKACPGVIFAAGYEPLVWFGSKVCVVAVPHGALLYKSLDQAYPRSQPTILVTHGEVTQRSSSFEMGSVSVPLELLKNDWHYVALGHIHAGYRVSGTAWYAGSTERCGWSDLPATPSWLKVTLGTTPGIRLGIEAIPIPHRPMIDLPPIEVGGYTVAMAKAVILETIAKHNQPGALYRAHLTGASRGQAREISAALRREEGAYIQVADSGPEGLRERFSSQGEGLETFDIHKLFQLFVDRMDEGDFREAFRRKGEELLEEAESSIRAEDLGE